MGPSDASSRAFEGTLDFEGFGQKKYFPLFSPTQTTVFIAALWCENPILIFF